MRYPETTSSSYKLQNIEFWRTKQQQHNIHKRRKKWLFSIGKLTKAAKKDVPWVWRTTQGASLESSHSQSLYSFHMEIYSQICQETSTPPMPVKKWIFSCQAIVGQLQINVMLVISLASTEVSIQAYGSSRDAEGVYVKHEQFCHKPFIICRLPKS